MDSPKVKRAIISVSDKTDLDIFAKGLVDLGVEIFSTGGTRTFLESNGIPCKDISAYTGFPEMMDGRLKTLHPYVFGGILCRHDREDDMAGLDEHGILTFELVCVNLYPFEATIAKPDVTAAQAIEKIDIGGPSLVRAAAKNHKFTAIVTNKEQFAPVLESMKANDGATTFELRRQLAAEAFNHTAKYDRAIANWFSKEVGEGDFPQTLGVTFERSATLRYGENPHQKAAVYAYNNLMDLDAALGIVLRSKNPACSVIKHNNPCGAAEGTTLAEACERAMAGDPLSAFGSVLGMNRVCDEATAKVLCEPGLFVEAIVAEDFEPKALELLTTVPKWRNNVRLMAAGDLSRPQSDWTWRCIEGGMLVQNADVHDDPEDQWQVITKAAPTEKQLDDLRFAWNLCRFVKSNAIVLCKDRMLLGAGAGQMSRVDSVKISIEKAGDRIEGAVLASDAFFPFADSIELAHANGITALIQPGGSKRDQEVIDACDKYGIAMIFTGYRHFRH